LTDMDWIPSTIMALGVAIPSIIGAYLSIKASNRAEAKASEANDNALKAKKQSEDTHDAAVAAAKILYDAKFDRDKLAPIQVELAKGAGIDLPLRVIDDKDKEKT
jgi:hypothetical protein